jgi:hypothetical protein
VADGVPGTGTFAAQWLACTLPCRRFADTLTDACARLGADVGRYSFIVVDSHHLLLAGLPAHVKFPDSTDPDPRDQEVRGAKGPYRPLSDARPQQAVGWFRAGS